MSKPRNKHRFLPYMAREGKWEGAKYSQGWWERFARQANPIPRSSKIQKNAAINTYDYRWEGLIFIKFTYDYRREGLKFIKFTYDYS